MPAAGFEPAIPASERPYTHALDGAVSVDDYSTVDYVSGLHMKCGVLQDIRERERERERERDKSIRKKCTYAKILFILVMICRTHKARQKKKIQTCITYD